MAPKDTYLGEKNWHTITSPTVRNGFLKIETELSGLTKEQVAAILGITNWKDFLHASQDIQNPANEQLISYLDTYGYTRDKRVVYNARRGQNIDDTIVMQLLEDFSSGAIDPENFCDEPAAQIKERYPDLSLSKISLLQGFVKREILFKRVELEDLSSQFPFPISKYNFFGRFIGGVADSPQNGIRYLKSSTPFFIQLKSLIEGLANEKRSFLKISELTIKTKKVSRSSKDNDKDEETGERDEAIEEQTQEVEKEMKGEFLEILIACIEGSNDLLNDTNRAGMKPIALPKLPVLSAGETSHIEPKEKKRLAIEIMNWIFTGKKDGELLNRKSLSIFDQKKLKDLERTIPQDRREIRKKKKALDAAYKEHEADPKLKNKNLCDRYEKELETLQFGLKAKLSLRKEIRSDKKQIKPIIKKLEEGSADLKSKIEAFRKEVQEARDSGKKIIFTAFENDGPSIFTEHLDRAFVQRGRDRSMSSLILRDCGFLMSDNFARSVHNNMATGASVTKTHFRNFSFHQSSLNQSAKYVIEEMLPSKESTSVRKLLDFVINRMPINGVSIKAQLKYLVSEYSGRRNPKVNDYLEYVFEHSIHIDKETIVDLLNILKDLKHTEIPQRCKELARERFHIPVEILDQFTVYSGHYRPDTLGRLPGLFEDKATLESYLDLGLDAFGMSVEVDQLIEGLTTGRGVVGIIDSTEYHPELVKEVMGEKEKEGTELTDEIWGDYVRPSERIIRSFSARLMEGRIGKALENHSLVSVIQPSKGDKVLEKLYKIILGVDLNLTPDLSRISQLLSDLHNYDENTILVINAENVTNLEQYKELVNLLEKFRFKVILTLREPLPGLPQVTLKPFLDNQVTQRVVDEEPAIRAKLGLQDPIPENVIQFTVDQVKRMRQPSDDPLNLTLHVLNGAAQNARMRGFSDIKEQDVTMSIAPIFHLPDGDQMKARIDAVDDFVQVAPLEVLGQADAIELIGKRMKSHILGLRDPTRPLSLLLPGPTGVGKTELMIKFAQAVNMPFFQIEGAEFSESHTVSRLVGSPSGYVGPDKGILFKFLEDNNGGVVFIDEIEKMHPDVYTALMNFFDKATLTAGDGSSVRRPGFVIVGASNAGADELKRGMSQREVKQVLSDAFVDRNGKPRPELVRRFEPIVMLAIEKEEFKKVIRLSLNTIGSRFGLINANLRLHDVDDVAAELLYEESKEVCKYAEVFKMGITPSSGGGGDTNTYYDMRHVSRALDTLVGDSMTEIVQDQISSGRYSDRDATTKVRLVGNREERKITLEVCEIS